MLKINHPYYKTYNVTLISTLELEEGRETRFEATIDLRKS